VRPDIRDQILAIFEEHRQTPGAPFEESRFLEFLLSHPKGKRPVHNSFRGLRRYNAFLEQVQMQFCVYFSMQDFDANYSLERFTQRVLELQQSRRSSLASFRSHIRRGFGWNTVFVLSLLGIGASYALWKHVPIAAGLVLLATLIGCTWALRSYLHWRAYHKKLEFALRSDHR
jgi:hypothetical protein